MWFYSCVAYAPQTCNGDGGEVKKFEASNNSLQSCLSFVERVQSQNVCCLPVQRPITPPPWGGGTSNKLEHYINDGLACLCRFGHTLK